MPLDIHEVWSPIETKTEDIGAGGTLFDMWKIWVGQVLKIQSHVVTYWIQTGEKMVEAMNQQVTDTVKLSTWVVEYWQSNFEMMSELWGIYEEMMEQHRDPLTHLSTQWKYQNFMTGQKARKQVLETALQQLRMLKVSGWNVSDTENSGEYIFPQQQQLENYIRTNLAFTFTFERPDYNVPNTNQETIYTWPRMDIEKFLPETIESNGESIFLIAPISGHFPTLLRKTIQWLTDEWYDVYITDWNSCLQMDWGTETWLDDYTQDIAEGFGIISDQLVWNSNFDVLAVCQPWPITLSAMALAEKKWMITPRSVTIMASPLDTSVNPTKVWEVWESMTQEVLQSAQLVSPKSWKKVYPGTYQINNFIIANFDSHIKNFLKLAYSTSVLDVEEEKMLNFYHEYFSVMDIPYDFFCETVERVFQKREWATGKVQYRDEILELTSINIPIAVVEWGKDDICGIGETKAAFWITGQLESKLNYLLCDEAWHYGVFAGKDFRNKVISFMKKFRDSLAS